MKTLQQILGNEKANSSHFASIIGNSAVTRDMEIEIDDVIMSTANEFLDTQNWLRESGKVKSLPKGIGSVFTKYQLRNEMTAAKSQMKFASQPNLDNLDYQTITIPVYGHMKEFVLDARQLAADGGIETDHIEEATRVVAEKVEASIYGGLPQVGGNSVFGLTTLPERGTYTLPLSWTDPSADILADVTAMIGTAQAQNNFGPYRLFVSGNQWQAITTQDYKAESEMTFKDRIEGIEGFGPGSVMRAPSFAVADDTVILVKDSRTAIEWHEGAPIQRVELTPEGGVNPRFLIYTFGSIVVKKDANGNTGIVHAAV